MSDQEQEPIIAAESVTLMRSPSVPVTINDLASLRGGALEVLDARVAVLETARKRAIRLTHPEDWVLFKSPDDRVTGYLQDAGCDRVRDILGVEVFAVGDPEKVVAADAQSFMYVIRGSGRSKLTQQVVENMEGGRASTDDFCKGATGGPLELLVRKAARANLDGNITRELTGLKSVPVGELASAWSGLDRHIEHCRKGRGFGTAEERIGATREGVPDVPPPTCPVCKAPDGSPLPLLFRASKGGKPAFFGCRNYTQHPQQKVIINADDWARKHATAAAAAAAKEAADLEDVRRQDEEILRRENGGRTGREPGQEG